MRKLLILAVMVAFAQIANAQQSTPESTAASLPAAATNSRQVYRVIDALNYGQCTPGGGTRRILCVSDGTNWVPVNTPLTKTDIGLSNADNTSDANKPVSTAQQTALDAKASTSALAAIATSGNYSDIVGRPTLATVATSGSYTDLTNKPTVENPLTFTAPLSRSSNTVNCLVASSIQAGCLSTTDWSAFNGKQTALGYTPLNPANNLSDVTAATARANLGLSTTANQADSTDKRYVTDAQRTVIQNTSGTNTGDETTATIISKLGLPVGVSLSAVQVITIADNGAGTNAAYTYTPSLAFNVLARFTCNDAQGCTITIAETNGFDNQSVVIVNAGTASVIVQDQSTVSETSGNFTVGQHDSISFRYSSDRYIEVSRSNN